MLWRRAGLAGLVLLLAFLLGVAIGELRTPRYERVLTTTEAKDLPPYPHDDYTFVYSKACSCPELGRVRVAVRGGEAVRAMFEDREKAYTREVPQELVVSINDLLAEAREARGVVGFEWVQEEGYPRSLTFDKQPAIVGEEYTYRIHAVERE